MTKPVTFKQDDVSRAVKGVQAAGLNVSRVELIDGKIVVVVGDGTIAEPLSNRDALRRAIEDDEAA